VAALGYRDAQGGMQCTLRNNGDDVARTETFTSCRWLVRGDTNVSFEETVVCGESRKRRSNLVVGQHQYMTKHFHLHGVMSHDELFIILKWINLRT
jgi:hypothetical protein